MSVLILNQPEVTRLLPMGACLDAVENAFTSLARGEATLPLRTVAWLPDRSGLLATMPAILGSPRAIGLKVITVFPRNEGTARDPHQGAVLLFDYDSGALLAIADATEITAIRTAAASGVATRLLARDDASTLALIGSGTQARTHLEAMLLVRPVRRVRIYSRTLEKARAFAERESQRRQVDIEAVASAREAVEGADLVCTVTSSKDPVLLGDWLLPGTHINAAGASIPTARELDTAAVVKARLFVDRRESALNEAGDFLIPKAEGALGDDHIVAEIGEVLLGRALGRRSREEITLFKSLGLAIEDLAAVHHVYEEAKRVGAGTSVALGGGRHTTP